MMNYLSNDDTTLIYGQKSPIGVRCHINGSNSALDKSASFPDSVLHIKTESDFDDYFGFLVKLGIENLERYQRIKSEFLLYNQ